MIQVNKITPIIFKGKSVSPAIKVKKADDKKNTDSNAISTYLNSSAAINIVAVKKVNKTPNKTFEYKNNLKE